MVCSLAALFTVRVRNDTSECLHKLLWTLPWSFIAAFTEHEAAAAPCPFGQAAAWGRGEQEGVLNSIFITVEDGQTGGSSAKRGYQGG